MAAVDFAISQKNLIFSKTVIFRKKKLFLTLFFIEVDEEYIVFDIWITKYQNGVIEIQNGRCNVYKYRAEMYTINIFRVEKEKDKVFKVFYVMMNSLELLLYFQVCSCFKEILLFHSN